MKPVPILTAFRKVLGLGDASWSAWRALIGGAFGATLDDDALATFRALTGGRQPTASCRVLAFAIGRRGGKDYVAVRVLIYLALLQRWVLAPGEVGVLLLLAVTKEQANIAMRYLVGALEDVPSLWAEVDAVNADSVVFSNGIEMRIAAADKASVRGVTLLGAILDEYAFWPPDQATEVVRALAPAMATQPAARLLIISSVYSATSPFGEMYRRSYGVDDPHTLFALATTRQMNPNITQDYIDAQLAIDPVANAAEYLSQFRTDVASFLDAELVDGLTRPEPRERPRLTTYNGGGVTYIAGLDVSGGRGDAAACAVAHAEGERVIVEACRRWPSPHQPDVVAAHVAEFLKSYGVNGAVADHYGADITRTTYAKVGVSLRATEHSRSDTYLRLLPLMTANRVELPPEPTLRVELLGLERKTGRAKDIVDHRAGGHDDLCKAVAIAAVEASKLANANVCEGLMVAKHDHFSGYFEDRGRMIAPWN